MLTITDNNSHVTITTDQGQVINFPKNQYEVSQDVANINRFIVSESDRIEYDFFWADVASPASANPQALMAILAGYFYETSDSASIVEAIEGTTGEVDLLNATTTPLTSSQTFTGTAVDVSKYPSVIVSVFADVSGTLYIEFSTNGTNWDSSIPFSVAAGVNEVHRLTVSKQYYRVRYVNNGTNQSAFRLQAIKGYQQTLTSALNSTIQRDADAIVSRTILYEDAISQGLFQNTSLVQKSGRNPNVSSGSVPEDMFNGSTVYAGFPITTPEELQVFSSNAGDTGTLTFTYLPTATSTAYVTTSVTLTGTTAVNTGITAYRVHTANYTSASATTFNIGTITIRWRTTTSVVFIVMPIGTSQSYASVYTIPFGATGYLKRVFCAVNDSASVSVQGALWIRTSGGTPRLRRNFSCQTGSNYDDSIYGGVPLSAMTDITMRIISSSSNSATVIVGGFEIILVSA